MIFALLFLLFLFLTIEYLAPKSSTSKHLTLTNENQTKPNQTNKLILILSSIFLLSFSACKNQSDEKTAVMPNLSQIQDVLVKNGRLAFRNRTTYETAVMLPPADTTNRKKIDSVALRTSTKINYPGFTSMLDVYNKSSNATSRLAGDTMAINDEHLAAFVSPEGIIEIGEWIFKINPAKSLVTVLNEKDENLYQDLLNDVSNPKIYKFSTNDDVLDLLEAGQTMGSVSNNRVSIFCGGGAAKSEQTSAPYQDPIDSRVLTGYSAYKKFGVYFHLYTTANLSGAKNPNLIILHKHAYYYKTNCKNYSESGPYAFSDYLKSGDYNYRTGNYYNFEQNIYMSTRGLSDYIVLAQYAYQLGTVTVPKIEQH